MKNSRINAIKNFKKNKVNVGVNFFFKKVCINVETGVIVLRVYKCRSPRLEGKERGVRRAIALVAM